jgi:magnesium-transporting ATPase (P-type)
LTDQRLWRRALTQTGESLNRTGLHRRTNLLRQTSLTSRTSLNRRINLIRQTLPIPARLAVAATQVDHTQKETNMVMIFVWIVIIVCIAALALWVIAQITSDPQITKVARIAIVVIAVLIILGLVANLFGIDTGLPSVKAVYLGGSFHLPLVFQVG